MNNLTISGFLGRDAEVRTTKTGKTVTNLTVAHTPREKRGEEWIDGETIWLKVSVWDDLPPVMFGKGVRVLVTGQLNLESYEKDGATRQNLVVKNATVALIHKFNVNNPTTVASTNNDWASPVNTDWAIPAAAVEDEIPF